MVIYTMQSNMILSLHLSVLHNIYKRFIVIIFSDLRNLILKKITENLINAAVFNRVNTVVRTNRNLLIVTWPCLSGLQKTSYYKCY